MDSRLLFLIGGRTSRVRTIAPNLSSSHFFSIWVIKLSRALPRPNKRVGLCEKGGVPRVQERSREDSGLRIFQDSGMPISLMPGCYKDTGMVRQLGRVPYDDTVYVSVSGISLFQQISDHVILKAKLQTRNSKVLQSPKGLSIP